MPAESTSPVPGLPHVKNGKQKAARSRNEHRYSRGLTCANCRARKLRCGGGQPSCKTCEVYNDECRYDKVPPMSQVMAMAKRLQEAEETITSLRAQSSTASREDSRSNHSLSPPVTTAASADQMAMSLSESTVSNAAAHSHTAPTYESPSFPPTQQSFHDPVAQSGPPKERLPPDLSVDENGEIQYYGPTSAIHDPPSLQPASSTPQISSTVPGISSTKKTQSTVAAHAQDSNMWEEFALRNASLQTGIPRHIIAKLLHMHWTWVSPMFMYVYKPAFIRGMATGGQYYSEFLLTVICAHAAKYQDGAYAEFLLARVRRLLGTAIQQPSSIPTVQALLQLSARELANGSVSQAWVYSGIAFRMASDLGLQHNGPEFRGFGPVDLEIRRRLFWSCYFWDKATSLYAGRLPAITETLHHDTLNMFDYSMELEMWAPYHGDSLNIARSPQNQYSPRTSHTISCLANSCRLSIIINDIIFQLYSRKSRTITESALREIETRLDLWRAESPVHLRYEPDSLPSISPPPHIISQNMLYYASVILAHRPFWSVPAHYEACISAARAIEKLVLLLESTFGLENITYLMGYCIYTGASAVLEEAKISNQGTAHPELRTFLRALNAGMLRCPLLERSLDIIAKSLSRVSLQQPHRPSSIAANGNSQCSAQIPIDTEGGHINSYIPAFPYLDPDVPLDFNNMASYATDSRLNSIAMLDSFPEMWLDNGEMICTL